jgi:hypothetical protein
MSKLIASMTAASVALILASPILPAEEAQPAQDQAQREQDYMKALKKCDPLTGAERQKCLDAAEKKLEKM